MGLLLGPLPIAWILASACRNGEDASDGSAVPDTSERPRLSNVLVVLADDLGVDRVAEYGAEQPVPMPRLSELFEEGVRFENAYATPVCSSTRSAMMTGRYGRRTGVGGVISMTEPAFALPLDELTLPEVVAAADEPWSSSLAGKWHLANTRVPDWPRHPLDSGFQWAAGSPGNLIFSDGDGYDRWLKDTNGEASRSTHYATTDTADDAVARIAAMPEPWLMVVTFNAPHTPLHAPPQELHHFDLGPDASPELLYAAMCEAMDTEFGRVLDAMSPEVRDRTTIVWMADNGTPWFGQLESDPDNEKGDLREGGVHVPMVVTGPLVGSPGSTSSALVHIVDILPTVADIAGVDPSALSGVGGAPPVLDGVSFVSYLRDPQAPAQRELLYNERFSPNGAPPYRGFDWRSVRDERWSLVRRGIDQLYDLENGGPDGGPDVLEDGIDAEEQAALDRLGAELDRLETEMTYEH